MRIWKFIALFVDHNGIRRIDDYRHARADSNVRRTLWKPGGLPRELGRSFSRFFTIAINLRGKQESRANSAATTARLTDANDDASAAIFRSMPPTITFTLDGLVLKPLLLAGFEGVCVIGYLCEIWTFNFFNCILNLINYHWHLWIYLHYWATLPLILFQYYYLQDD